MKHLLPVYQEIYNLFSSLERTGKNFSEGTPAISTSVRPVRQNLKSQGIGPG